MKQFYCFVFIIAGFIGQGQTITKKQAIRIAKQDSKTEINKIEKSELIKDTIPPCWIITEKINLEKEYDKVRQAKKTGTTFIFADVILINANTGEILSRTGKEVGKIHRCGKW